MGILSYMSAWEVLFFLKLALQVSKCFNILNVIGAVGFNFFIYNCPAQSSTGGKRFHASRATQLVLSGFSQEKHTLQKKHRFF